MEEAGEALRVQVLREEDIDEDVLDLENLTDKEEAPIIRLVDTTIFNALQRRASDIHMETTSTGFQIKYRIDGSLYPPPSPSTSASPRPSSAASRSCPNSTSPRSASPRTGASSCKVRGPRHRLPRLHHAHHPRRGRRHPHPGQGEPREEFKTLSLSILGFSDKELVRLRRFAHEPYGMFLVTGPTGCGKTTTLYAVPQRDQQREDKIITIEDPVEYQLEGITQIPVTRRRGSPSPRACGRSSATTPTRSWSARSATRRRPRSPSSPRSRATWSSPPSTPTTRWTCLSRFQHMGVEVYNFVSALNCILAQRLVRTLCLKCKRPIPAPGPEELKENGITAEWASTATFFDKVGCVDCNGTGFRGRQAIIEFMGLNDDLRELITRRASVREIKAAARSFGMQSLRESALEKVRLGVTTFAEINKVIFRESE